MHKIRSNGIEIAYDIRGEGFPVVLIPGLATGAWSWFKQVPALAEHFRVVTYDPRGVGESEKSPPPYSAQLLAADVAGLLESLGIQRAHILGASLGGIIAQEFALQYPDKTEGLVLTCTSFGGPNHVPPSAETLAVLMSVGGLNSEERTRKNVMYGFTPEYVKSNPDDIETVVQLRLGCPVPEFTYMGQLQAAATFVGEDRVGRITARTLVVTGNRDNIIPVQNSRNLAAKIPNSTLIEFDGGGHVFFIESADNYNRTVVGFLSGK